MFKIKDNKQELNEENSKNIIDKFLNKIICGDCIEKLKEIPSNTVSLIFTDPPITLV